MNESFMLQVQQIETYCEALTKALPSFRRAGETLEGGALKVEIDRIEAEFGLAEIA